MRTVTKLLSRFGKFFFFSFMMGIFGLIVVVGIVIYYSAGLPSSAELENYTPKTMTRLYDNEGHLLAEYAEQKRVYVSSNSIPEVVKNAFISAEDKNFYNNNGIDIFGIARAAINNIKTKITGSGSISGASTITQQVVKNLLLTNERSLERKVKEAILAVRISGNLSKDKILEIYLNEIFLGKRSYGVGAAAQTYFGKSVQDLNIEEAALLAAMPKAPSKFSPDRNYDRAKQRRDWVLGRMADDGYITESLAEEAQKREIALVEDESSEDDIVTNYFAEDVRRKLVAEFGKERLYGGGLAVRTTLDPKLQRMAEKALYDGIIKYDREHGWRGAISEIEDLKNWQTELENIPKVEGIGEWDLAVVLAATSKRADIGLADGSKSYIDYSGVKWARLNLRNQRFGGQPASVRNVLSKGDVIAVSKKGKSYVLEQVPNVNGAITVMDPQTGRVLAMVGGYTFGSSHFNRATQAKRQPGSAFKPFVYLAALENGFTPATLIEDGPIEISSSASDIWMPKNYSGDFLGDTSLRKGLEKSRNNMTILIALMLGIEKVQEVAKRMGIYKNPLPYYSMTLGSQETTLMKLSAAYATLANGGKKVEPKMIDRVQDNKGKTIYKSDKRKCTGCTGRIDINQIPTITDPSKQVIDPVVAYQLTSMLEGVVQRGTAVRARKIGKPLAGKTGTTNDNFDTWFMGYSPDYVVGTYIGFDIPRTLGARATGSSVALPVFINFMEQALAEIPAKPFKAPEGVILSKVDVTTGYEPDDYSQPENVIFEIFNPNISDIIYSDEYLDYQEKLQSSQEIYEGGTSGIY